MTIEHKTFVVERELAASPKHAFRFFSEPALKERWTSCHPDWTVLEEAFDFRVGGVEAKRWRTDKGDEQTFLARYLDIVPAQRIVYAFDMSFAGERLSASLATVELFAEAARTRMVFTEQIAWLGDASMLPLRIAGTGDGLDLLADIIAMEAAGVH
ncbi:SRPBCC family protein [Mesorhizobium retamae]|uniref:SRPBCC family protein n=1 Tax=Mesorhizobium retamae TaxID=2912854 RepID=A0ABS9Q9Y5_9HYPH|nr:SRPBCC family protein [Mesorhizobium sp. IRAMC:0171]MCG7504215.1 SRPBCC family protein [Mesorhizobium sp. IRAMC:0171]